ncbi:MAG TPA: hypothetical protein VEV38_12685 [Candidatus Eremiobacteraceae bacterium]|nr:hypothetical protein [Candidatus Eremiobacteraceae bacterium]
MTTPILGPAGHQFNAAAMVSTRDAWAVGQVSSEFGNATATLAEHWDGSSWTVVPTPSPGLGWDVGDGLNGVAAVASNDVWAVGQSGFYFGGQSAMIEHWDGSQWSVFSSPYVPSSSLTSISATSSNNVWAAGFYYSNYKTYALVERWDGTQWFIVTDNLPGLTSISATSPTDVWATGNDVQHWDGSSWTEVSTANAFKVAAVSRKDVWIIQGREQLVHWDGSTWTTFSSPQIGNLWDIKANSTTNAWVVGYLYDNQPETEHWDGSTWTQITTPTNGHDGTLFGIALKGSDAIGVGSHAGGILHEPIGLEMAWNGSRWRLRPSPVVDPLSNTFNAVFASSPNDAWAVGWLATPGSFQYPEGNAFPLTEHWNGQDWQSVRPPVKAVNLEDVGGISSTQVWAVGNGGEPCGNGQGVLEHWNGVKWENESPFVCASAGSDLGSLAVISKTELWAVGSDSEIGARGSEITHELVLRRQSNVWTTFQMPDDPYTGGLSSIRAASADDIWAVGVSIPTTQGHSASLIYHWDGTTWTDFQFQNPEAVGNLDALAVVSATDVWAVGGQSRSRRGKVEPLIVHFDGTSWTEVHHLPPPSSGALTAIVAISANDVWASSPSSFIAHWNGSTWSFFATASGDSPAALGVIPALHTVWSVGSYPTPYLNAQAWSAFYHC